jgi:hypothetical protein
VTKGHLALRSRRRDDYDLDSALGEESVSSIQRVYERPRRSSRINYAIPVTVQGSDAFRAPYLERVSTMVVSCHGCRYQSRNDVLQGDVVLLELEKPESRSKLSTRARVKQVRRLMTSDMPFEVIVELETPGNVWGVPTPPVDWFPAREASAAEPSSSGRDLRVVARNESQIAPTPEGPTQLSHLQKETAAASLSPFLGQLMVGLGEQIQLMTAQAARAVIVKEQGRLLEEFRGQLQEEATKTLERVIATSKEEISGRVLRELNGAHEAAVRATYERWTKKLEQDFGNTAERAVALGNQVNEHVERAAAGAIERVQGEMDASRRDAADQFRSRLRGQLTPLVEEAGATLQKLAAFEDELKVRSLAICGQFSDFIQQETKKSSEQIQEKIAGFEKQFETGIQERMAQGYDELDKKSAATIEARAQALLDLSQSCEQTAQTRLASLAESTVSQTTNSLKDKTTELARQFSSELENYRSYLEFMSRSIAEIAKKPDVRPPSTS